MFFTEDKTLVFEIFDLLKIKINNFIHLGYILFFIK